MRKTAADHVNEVARRMGHDGVALRGHHCTILPYANDLKFQIVCTSHGRHGRLEAVWTFDKVKDRSGVNRRRGDACQKSLEAAGPPQPVQRVDLANDTRVGFLFDVPPKPTAEFYDMVAERAKWALAHARPSQLDRV